MDFSRCETLHMTIDDRLRGVCLRFEPSPVRKVAVPFDERRDGSALADNDAEELRVGDRTVMAVNEQKLALVVRRPPGTWIVVQVPPCTNFQAFPWKSTVDVPWQVVPGPAAQSFWPFKATP
jgi:hypothetical protein